MKNKVLRSRIAASETTAAFNKGATSKAVVLDLCGVTPGAQTMSALRKQDHVRIKNAVKKRKVSREKTKASFREER